MALRPSVGIGAAFVVTLALSSSAQEPGARRAPADHPLLPRELEIELALNAAPPHLRDGAAVWVLESTGYVKAREGRNAFACIVSRRGGDVFPVCWDAEGAKTLMPIDLDDATRSMAGQATPRSSGRSPTVSRPGATGHRPEPEWPTCCRRCGTESTRAAR